MVSPNAVMTLARSLDRWVSASTVGNLGESEGTVRREAARRALSPTREQYVSGVVSPIG